MFHPDRNEIAASDTEIRPFHIAIPQLDIEDLQDRLVRRAARRRLEPGRPGRLPEGVGRILAHGI